MRLYEEHARKWGCPPQDVYLGVIEQRDFEHSLACGPQGLPRKLLGMTVHKVHKTTEMRVWTGPVKVLEEATAAHNFLTSLGVPAGGSLVHRIQAALNGIHTSA